MRSGWGGSSAKGQGGESEGCQDSWRGEGLTTPRTTAASTGLEGEGGLVRVGRETLELPPAKHLEDDDRMTTVLAQREDEGGAAKITITGSR